MVFVGSGTISSWSASSRVPSPRQVGQAPYGELNENDRGSRSSMDSGWSFGQASCSENRRSRCGSSSGRSTKSRTSTPPASPSAVSTESVSRRFALGLTASRSTTTSMSCFSYFFSFGGSLSDDDRAVDPGPAEALRLQLAEQLGVLALAAAHHRRQHLEPGALVELEDPVDDLLRASAGLISSPQIGQCGMPIRAYSSRR